MESVSNNNDPKGVPGLRWQMPAILLLTVLVSYFDRMNITYAIAKIGAEYGWTTKEIGSYGGLLMNIFYVGYGLTNMLLSPIGARFGPGCCERTSSGLPSENPSWTPLLLRQRKTVSGYRKYSSL